jgi:hypothetical protein
MDADHAPQRFPAQFRPQLQLVPSRLAAAALALPVLLALTTAISDPPAWHLPLVLLLLAWLWLWWRRERTRGLRRLALSDDGLWRLHYADGRRATCRLAGHAILGTLFVQLLLRDVRRPGWWPARRVIVWRDAAAPEAFRRLCVFLRLGGQGTFARIPFV